MLDFSSALYLGLRHPSRSLRPWARLSSGTPAALEEPSGAAGIGLALAELQGCAAATLATSTLHLFWDLFRILGADGGVAIHVDAAAYPVARWGVERAGWRGAPVRSFRHHDADALERVARAAGRRGLRPLVVADGLCPRCGHTAPLRAYRDVARRFGGLVVIDDTQALGVLGSAPGPDAPYGHGGGGSLRWHDIAGPELLVAASLAKAFGAPLASLAGAAAVVERFEAESETRVHSSPPSVAVLRAAERALTLNRLGGDELRRRLAMLVSRFRARLAELGLRAHGGLFPVQSLAFPGAIDPVALHGLLLARGVRTVLQRPRPNAGPRISFLISACHRVREIDSAVEAIAEATAAHTRRIGVTR